MEVQLEQQHRYMAEGTADRTDFDDDIERPDSVIRSGRQLSTTSKYYDRNGKGYLDATELALRRMDSSNRGFLTMDKIHSIMEELQDEQRQNKDLLSSLQEESRRAVSYKRGVLLLCAFTLMLAISNIGTSLVAARLAKDTRVDGSDFADRNGNRLATTTKTVSIAMEPVSQHTRRRFLLDENENDICQKHVLAGNSGNCTIQGQMKYKDAKALYEQFCPSRDNQGRCQGDAVQQVELSCNGYQVHRRSYY